MKIALIACVKKKRKGAHPAKDLYISPLFRLALNYVTHNFQRYYILSAKYGLLRPEKRVRGYNKTLNRMSVKNRRMWAVSVARGIRKVVLRGNELYFYAGKRYREELMRLLGSDYKCKAPLKGLSIGRQLQWYKRHL